MLQPSGTLALNLKSTSVFLDPVTAQERRKPLRFAVVILLLVWVPAMLANFAGAALAAMVDLIFNAPAEGYGDLLEKRLLSPGVIHSEDVGLVAQKLPNLFYFGTAAALLLLFATRRAGRSTRTFLTSHSSIRWKLLWAAMAATAACYLAGLSLAAFTSLGFYEAESSWREAGLGRALTVLICIPVMVTLLVTAEEVVFRGWLLQQIAAFTRWTPALLGISTLPFVAAHGDIQDWERAVQLGLAGAAFAWVALRTGGLEAACGCHIAMNLALTFLDRDRTFTSVVDATGATVSTTVGSARPMLLEWTILWALAASPALVAEGLVRSPLLRSQGSAGQGPAERQPSA